MNNTITTSTATGSWVRRTLRWMATFTGFPLGGLAAWLIVGPVDSIGTAVLGGLITGGILGAVQAIGLGRLGGFTPAWVGATAVGMATGLGIGSAVVGYGTSLSDLAMQGAISGLVVGIGQALVLRNGVSEPRLGALTLAWPPFLAASWAVGWTITTLGGIGVEDQFTVFGSFGAITVAALTAVLPFALARIPVHTSTEKSHS
ncbi:MAG: hypothetical protein ABWZ98_09020 [Nakamurella sp.]